MEFNLEYSRTPSPLEEIKTRMADMLHDLQNLPYGKDVETARKKELYDTLVTMASHSGFSEWEKSQALRRIEEVYTYSLMTKEDAVAAGAKNYLTSR
jgi:hypothetical protein